MSLFFIDFETYWDRAYTLRKLTPPEYIFDSRYSTHGMAVAKDGEASLWFDKERTADFFLQMRDEQKAGVKHKFVSYNALFDMSIVAWRYNYVPELMIDVLGMARAQLKRLQRFDLKTVARAMEVGEKGDEVMETQGVTTEELYSEDSQASGLLARFINYANNDNDLQRLIFKKLAEDGFPSSEYRVMDLVLRAAIKPQMKLDVKRLSQHLINTKAKKQQLLARCGADRASLMSADKFAKILEAEGITVATKPSPSDPSKWIYALSKTDKFLQDLAENPNERLATLAQARLGMKSTLEETRTERLMNIGAVMPGRFAPVPIKYGAALTHRFGGDWKINLQNLPRGSEIRKCLIAPKDNVVIAADMEQIEARMLAWLAGCDELVRQFAEKKDPYSRLGEKIFDYPPFSVTKDSHPIIRFIGKTGILGLGYGAGNRPSAQFPTGKFHWMVHTLAKTQLGEDIEFTEAEALKAVSAYRKEFHEIPELWATAGALIETLRYGRNSVELGPVTFSRGNIELPNGLCLQYPNIRYESIPQEEFDNDQRKKQFYGETSRQSIYGAKLIENIVQAICRVLLMDAAVRLADRGYRFAMQVHDELVFVVPHEGSGRAREIIEEEMTRVPDWCKGVPLAVAVSKGAKTYGDAK